ncbi:hypothetical protein DV711_03595 [Motiliproteus coralliicola]|uniref:Uncharacterized protein n=1 Tax=Motiliproteus coralliicola TaxID=2283196 RepID=A0A369WVW7_9GAMM|nr:hypothetical protein [Motiliproteus coralliicola]RDE24686.1 hypothetical protein DV711_03595 [Motiliproteus coralliicola]
MTSLHNSLAKISQQYTVFVKDQVLTEQQLNSISDYLDDQVRLSRTALTGVGIILGLKVSRTDTALQLSKGLGITADGDLLVNYQPQRFDRFKEYPLQAPKYPPFGTEDGRIPLMQLIPEGEADTDTDIDAEAKPIDELDSSGLVFVLLAEAYIEDKDICTGTNCDNGSRTYTSRPRLLATHAEFAQQLLGSTPTRQSLELTLEKLQRRYPEAVTLSPGINTQSEWFKQLRSACDSAFTQLHGDLTSFGQLIQPLLQAHIESDSEGSSSSGWATRLAAIHNRSRTETSRLLYYYEFLGDLAQGWNELLDSLAELQPHYLMTASDAAKHLLLGGVAGTAPRQGFYPSPARADNSLTRVRFQLDKLNALLIQFGWSHISALKITPSSSVDPSVPGYYQAALFDHWSFDVSRRGRSRYLLGYQADNNQPLGGAESPLLRRQSEFDYYRIEGVIGKSFSSTESTLRKLIRQHHLPFSVTGTLVEGDFRQVIKPHFRPRWGLRDFQYLLKQDLTYQLQDVSQFSSQFKNAVIREADDNRIRDGDIADIKLQVSTRDADINRGALSAISLLQKPALSADEQQSFNAEIGQVIKTAGLFKNDVAKVSNTHFPTSFDQLIVNRSPIWVDWIDRINKEQDKKDTEDHLLPNFINRHPGLEVAAGVPRGGTFVLLYNSGGTIVGSAMLSHYIEPALEETARPTLPRLDPPFQAIPIPGIKVMPSLDFEIERKITNFGDNLNKRIDEKIQFQSVYSDVFKNSLGIVRDLYAADSGTKLTTTKDRLIGDQLADALANQLVALETQIQTYDLKIQQTDSVEERERLQTKKSQAQEQMASSMVELADYTAKEPTLATSSGSQLAVEKIVTGSTALSGNQAAIELVKTGIEGIQDTSLRNNLNTRLGGRLGGF